MDIAAFSSNPSLGNAAWVLLDIVCFDPTGIGSTSAHLAKTAHVLEETAHVADVVSHSSTIAKAAEKTVGQGFETFNDAKKVLGSPGQDKQWHHIVEQSQISKSGFSPTQIQNTNNLIAVDKATHAKISGYYSSKQAFTGGKIVRDWLAGQSYNKQFEFGIQKLRDFEVIK